jgi:hypothetical protein
MDYAIYKFEEVPFTLNGTAYFAKGEIELAYSTQRGDRDIGEPDRFIIEWETTGFIDALLIDDDGEEAWGVINGSPADVKASLTAAIIADCSDHIASFLERESGRY